MAEDLGARASGASSSSSSLASPAAGARTETAFYFTAIGDRRSTVGGLAVLERGWTKRVIMGYEFDVRLPALQELIASLLARFGEQIESAAVSALAPDVRGVVRWSPQWPRVGDPLADYAYPPPRGSIGFLFPAQTRGEVIDALALQTRIHDELHAYAEKTPLFAAARNVQLRGAPSVAGSGGAGPNAPQDDTVRAPVETGDLDRLLRLADQAADDTWTTHLRAPSSSAVTESNGELIAACHVLSALFLDAGLHDLRRRGEEQRQSAAYVAKESARVGTAHGLWHLPDDYYALLGTPLTPGRAMFTTPLAYGMSNVYAAAGGGPRPDAPALGILYVELDRLRRPSYVYAIVEFLAVRFLFDYHTTVTGKRVGLMFTDTVRHFATRASILATFETPDDWRAARPFVILLYRLLGLDLRPSTEAVADLYLHPLESIRARVFPASTATSDDGLRSGVASRLLGYFYQTRWLGGVERKMPLPTTKDVPRLPSPVTLFESWTGTVLLPNGDQAVLVFPRPIAPAAWERIRLCFSVGSPQKLADDLHQLTLPRAPLPPAGTDVAFEWTQSANAAAATRAPVDVPGRRAQTDEMDAATRAGFYRRSLRAERKLSPVERELVVLKKVLYAPLTVDTLRELIVLFGAPPPDPREGLVVTPQVSFRNAISASKVVVSIWKTLVQWQPVVDEKGRRGDPRPIKPSIVVFNEPLPMLALALRVAPWPGASTDTCAIVNAHDSSLDDDAQRPAARQLSLRGHRVVARALPDSGATWTVRAATGATDWTRVPDDGRILVSNRRPDITVFSLDWGRMFMRNLPKRGSPSTATQTPFGAHYERVRTRVASDVRAMLAAAASDDTAEGKAAVGAVRSPLRIVAICLPGRYTEITRRHADVLGRSTVQRVVINGLTHAEQRPGSQTNAPSIAGHFLGELVQSAPDIAASLSSSSTSQGSRLRLFVEDIGPLALVVFAILATATTNRSTTGQEVVKDVQNALTHLPLRAVGPPPGKLDYSTQLARAGPTDVRPVRRRGATAVEIAGAAARDLDEVRVQQARDMIGTAPVFRDRLFNVSRAPPVPTRVIARVRPAHTRSAAGRPFRWNSWNGY